MTTHSSILAWKIPWTEEPGNYGPRGCKELDTTEHARIVVAFTLPTVLPLKWLLGSSGPLCLGLLLFFFFFFFNKYYLFIWQHQVLVACKTFFFFKLQHAGSSSVNRD